MRKRKVTYPVAKTATKSAARTGAGPEPAYARPNLVAIDLTAGGGREGLSVGQRVRILGTGLYSGQIVVIESLAAGVIPAALVRTDAGGSRRVRTIDLEPMNEAAEKAELAAQAEQAAPTAVSAPAE